MEFLPTPIAGSLPAQDWEAVARRRATTLSPDLAPPAGMTVFVQ